MVVFRFGLLFCLLALSLARDKRVFLTSFTNPLTGGSSGGLTGGSGGLTGGLTGGSSGLTGGLTGGSGGLTGGLKGGLTGGLTGGLSGLSTGGFFLGGTTNLLSSVTNYWKNLFGALFNVPATSQTNSLFNSLPGLNGGSGLGGLTGGGGSSGSLPSGGSSLGQYNVDKTKISVSGLSAGGAMATQFHVIYSSEIMGAGIIAGLPFYCTRGKGVMEALGNCMKTPGNIDIAGIVAATKQGASGGQIDATSNMQNDKVYIFDGRADTTVNPAVGPKIQEFYQQFTSQGNIKTVFSYNAQHGQPVDNPREGACAMQNSRWINNCGYSAAYDLLNHIYGNLKKPAQGAAQTGELLAFSQTEFISNAASNGMDEVGYIYVPQACKNAQQACKLHIAFHGCKQGRKVVGDAYVRHAGYNEVADLNNIIILYPQAQASTMNGNINGCFDWWGYAGKTFATKDGIQEKAVKGMLDRVTG